MTQNEVSIIKNAVLDATEAYVDARLSVLDFVKTQIGVVINYVKGKYTKIVPQSGDNPKSKGWYEYNKSTYTYTLTTDTTVQNGKGYYALKNDNKYYHTVKCDNGKVVYSNVLSIGNIEFPKNSVVFLLAPNADIIAVIHVPIFCPMMIGSAVPVVTAPEIQSACKIPTDAEEL